ncbi:MAG: hypothetical protein ABJB22_00600 [Verrucomicrobiota bacterium]
MARTVFIALLGFTWLNTTSAQFTPVFLQNNSYWGDGKAEFNIYDAQIVREGHPRQCEALHILVREPFDPKQFVKSNDAKRPETIAVLKLNQILHIPTGLSVSQQMHSSFWRIDDARLWKFSLTSNDSIGNTYKEAHRAGEQFAYEFRTYWDGMADGKQNIALPANGIFYDELPLRVRLIDFSKPSGEFEIQLAPTTITSRKDNIVFKPAKISFTSTARSIDVAVRSDAGTDHFILDRDFPFMLREWTAADGSRFKLKRSLKVAYENYTKAGDRERALADPMLRHPD